MMKQRIVLGVLLGLLYFAAALVFATAAHHHHHAAGAEPDGDCAACVWHVMATADIPLPLQIAVGAPVAATLPEPAAVLVTMALDRAAASRAPPQPPA